MNILKRSCILVTLILFTAVLAQAQDVEGELDAAVEAYANARSFIGTVLVAKGDDMLYEKGFGMADYTWSIPNAPDVRYRIGSVTKQFTAAVILKMVEAGAVELDAVIRDYIPYYPEPQGSRVTIHQLLNHTSGIPSYTNLPDFGEDVMLRDMPADSILAKVWHLDFEFEPGTDYAYNNSGYFILGVIIEKAASMSYEKALKTYLFQPLALENTGMEKNSVVTPRLAEGYRRTPLGWDRAAYMSTSWPFSAGMLYSTVGDLHRWTRALHAGEVFDSEETYRKMTTPYKQNYGYGLGIQDLNLGDRKIPAIMHSGGINGFTSQCWYLPEDAYTIVVLDNAQGASQQVAGAIVRVLYGLPLEPVLPSIADEVARVQISDGVDEALERYDQLKESESDAWDFSENELNLLGYWYLQRGEIAEALAVFRKNIDAYPEASNPYDSMGEALYEAGRYEESIEMYRKALELNPGSRTAPVMLRKMGVDVEEKVVEIDEDVQESYVGKYELQPGFVLTVTREGSRMFTQATGQQRVEIYPSSQKEFYLKVVEA
ncbi:MAG: serine hydrolase, partial [Bacteroidota bacterium]|nr:serine hydrolase [Bacteroidota bacterium]